MNKHQWFIRQFFSEKEINRDHAFEIETPSNTHMVEAGVVIDTMIDQSCMEHQAMIEKILRQIDQKNGDVYHFLEHMAKGIVEAYEQTNS